MNEHNYLNLLIYQIRLYLRNVNKLKHNFENPTYKNTDLILQQVLYATISQIRDYQDKILTNKPKTDE